MVFGKTKFKAKKNVRIRLKPVRTKLPSVKKKLPSVYGKYKKKR